MFNLAVITLYNSILIVACLQFSTLFLWEDEIQSFRMLDKDVDLGNSNRLGVDGIQKLLIGFKDMVF
jgi:hypothetical protein